MVFRPNRQIEQQRRSHNWPIVRIAPTDAAVRCALVVLIEATVHYLHDSANLLQHREAEVYIKTALVRNVRYISAWIVFTRSRAYHKNDQAWVEQKNGAIVRKLIATAGWKV